MAFTEFHENFCLVLGLEKTNFLQSLFEQKKYAHATIGTLCVLRTLSTHNTHTVRVRTIHTYVFAHECVRTWFFPIEPAWVGLLLTKFL